MQSESLRRFVAVLCVFVILSGCAQSPPRVENSADFATAGIAYVDALPAVFEESFRLTVAANTHQLLLARSELDENERMAALSNADAALEARLAVLEDLRGHSLLLRSYFVSLRSLASPDNAAAITDAADNLVGRLAEMSPSLSSKAIGDVDIAERLSPPIQLAVGAYQNAVLRDHLQRHGATIERQLELQRAMLDALVDDMTDNAQLLIEIEQLNPIVEEFVEAERVSSSWGQRRVDAFGHSARLPAYDRIRKAAASMHRTWVALVQSENHQPSVESLIEDLEQFVAITQSFRSTQ